VAYLTIGTTIHLTTVPLYILINLLIKRNYKGLVLIALTLAIIVYFDLSLIKISSYSLNYNLNNIIIDGIKWIILSFIIYIAVVIRGGKFPNDECTKSFIIMNIVYIVLIPFGNIGDRVLMVPILMINGVFIGNMLSSIKDKRFIYAIIFLLIINKILNFSDFMNNYYWVEYPMYNLMPFYYIYI
jgi:hypothetical protein